MNFSKKNHEHVYENRNGVSKTRMKFTSGLFCLFFTILLLSACSKDGNDGSIGPQGPQGEQGPAGPQGTDGETGTANVIFSPWIASGFETPIANDFGSFLIDAPEITQEVIDGGLIMVYGKDDNNVIFALPLTLQSTFTVESYWFQFEDPGSFEMVVQEVNGDDLDDIFIDNEFRYVIIPEGNSTSGKSASSLDYSKMTYEEITENFGIQD